MTKLVFVWIVGVLGGIQQVGAQPVDPLATFKDVVASCETQINDRPSENLRQMSNGDWIRTLRSRAAVLYDVKRTESLVSPYSAHIRAEWVEQSYRKKTEQEARAATENEASLMSGAIELRYAFRESKWALTGGTSDVKTKRPGDASFDGSLGVIPLTPEALTRVAWLSQCIP